MRKLLAFGSLIGISLPLLAAAQPPPPPPPPPGGGGGGGMAGDPVNEPKMRFDAALIIALPQGDLEDTNVDTSAGIGLQFGYTVVPNLSLLVGIRYFLVQLKEDAGGDLSNYDFVVGGRYAFPVSPTAKVFGEGMLQYTTLTFDSDGGGSESESGVGFQARGGAMFQVGGRTSIGGALSFSTSTVEVATGVGSLDIDVAWLGIEGFVSFGF